MIFLHTSKNKNSYFLVNFFFYCVLDSVTHRYSNFSIEWVIKFHNRQKRSEPFFASSWEVYQPAGIMLYLMFFDFRVRSRGSWRKTGVNKGTCRKLHSWRVLSGSACLLAFQPSVLSTFVYLQYHWIKVGLQSFGKFLVRIHGYLRWGNWTLSYSIEIYLIYISGVNL